MPRITHNPARTGVRAHEWLCFASRGRFGRARPAEEGDAERAHKAGGGKRGGERQQRRNDGRRNLQFPLRQLRAFQDR